MAKKWVPFSEEHKRKLSLSHIGMTYSEESKKRMSDAHIWKRPSEETRKKLSEARKWKSPFIMTDEIRKKISDTKWWIRKLYKNCLQCWKSFTDQKGTYWKKWEQKKYCCIKCSSISQIGKNKPLHTDDWKIQNSMRHKGKINSPETRRKIAIGKMWANNPLWKWWITEEHKCIRNSAPYRDWRTAVFRRDKYACTCCKKKWGWSKEEKRQINIQADHIKPFSIYPELRLDLDNGRTLCEDCHRKTPTWGAKKEYWISHPILG